MRGVFPCLQLLDHYPVHIIPKECYTWKVRLFNLFRAVI